MSDPTTPISPAANLASPVFSPKTKAQFRASYPETAHQLSHELRDHPLLEIEALAQLGETLPEASLEFNRGDLPVGVDGKPGSNGLTIGETIRGIETSNSWAVLKNIEQSAPYAGLLEELLSQIDDAIASRTGERIRSQGFIFISSAQAVTPYHFDPEHNILLQLRGTKAMTVFPAGDPRFASDNIHEDYHTGGARELRWDEGFAPEGETFTLKPGDALYVPVMAPHFVRNGPETSISLSITWRSEWSFAEADARSFNKFARRLGFDPAPPGRWPQRNRAKAIAWRALRRLPGLS